jgi:hypothetical protein
MHKTSEAETRRKMIDPSLERAGWNLKNHAQVGLEIPVDGYDKEQFYPILTKSIISRRAQCNQTSPGQAKKGSS